MPCKTINIRSRDGGEFDCYLVTPETDDPLPAIVFASAVHGVDADIRAIADEFAAPSFIVAASTRLFRGLFTPRSVVATPIPGDLHHRYARISDKHKG